MIEIKSFFASDQGSRSRWAKAAIGLFFSLVYVYTFGCLYLGWFNASWVRRLVILGITTPLILLVVYWLIFKLPSIGQGYSRKVWGVFWLIGITAGALLWPVYSEALPVIPARHSLEITILCDQASPSTGKEVQILWINRLVLPSKVESPVTNSEIESSGS